MSVARAMKRYTVLKFLYKVKKKMHKVFIQKMRNVNNSVQ